MLDRSHRTTLPHPTTAATPLLSLLLAAACSSGSGGAASAAIPASDAASDVASDAAPADAGASSDATAAPDAGSPDAATGTDGSASAADSAAPADVAPPPAEYRTLTVVQLNEWMKNKDFLLLNVHIPYAGQIPGTDQHVPYNQVAQLEAALDHHKGRKAVLYCKTGPMSHAASNQLVKLGYYAIWDLPGGMVKWQLAGNKIEYKK